MLKTYYLENEEIKFGLLNKGCAITEITLKKLGCNTVLTYDALETYLHDPFTMNAMVGNHAGRIKNASYEHKGKVIQLQANDGTNHLHGGDEGLSHQYFTITKRENALIAKLEHQDVEYTITYKLSGLQVLIEMLAVPRDEMLINLTQHTYFNLSEEKTIGNHNLIINGSHIQALDDSGVPMAEKIPVKNTVFDFTMKSQIKKALEGKHEQFSISKNIDHPYHTQALYLESPNETIGLSITSDAPVMVVYLANYFNDGVTKLKHRGLAQDYEGIAVEPQYLPNDVNLKQGPSQFFTKENPFKRIINYNYTIKKD